MSAQQRREQILDVTHAIVDAEGFYAATPQRVAAAAGINRSLIYQQFGDLAGLFVALVERERGRAAAQFADVVGQAGQLGTDHRTLDRAFEGVLAAVDEHPARWRLFLFPPEGAPPELYHHLERSQAAVVEYLRATLVAVNPHLRDPEYTARVVHAVGRELLQLRLSDPAATTERIKAFIRSLSVQVREDSAV